MTTELPPEVERRAAEAAREVHALVRNGKVMPYADAEEQRYYELVATRWLDAVVSVVAPEIARPLRERAEHAEALIVEEVAHVRQLEAAIGPLQAQLDQSRKVYAEFVTGQHEEAQARVEVLTAALTELISEVARRGWANDHEVLDPARAALAAGTTESEPVPD